MKLFSLLAFSLFVVQSAASLFASDKPPAEPVVWGQYSQNIGCVIFQEGRKTSGRFYGVAVTTKTVGKLSVIETHNYSLDQDVFLETQENMDALMQRAQKDHVKYVKIPEKYSSELLEKARASCKQDQATGN
jgi:hypothetical protein